MGRQNAQGIGLIYDVWKFGYSLQTQFNWTYQVDIQDQSLINEDITFDLNVFEIVRSTPDKTGPHLEIGFKEMDFERCTP